MSETEALFSLVAGEGDGAILGLAAGDAAGGAWELGYSAFTQQATVLAYHLIERATLDIPTLVLQLRELDGLQDEDPVYRAETGHFRGWLDRAAAGSLVPEEDRSLDAGPRAVPLGVIHRRAPELLQEDTIRLGSLFHADALSVLTGSVVASAVAAACFGQSGRDFIAGIAESVTPVANRLSLQTGLARTEDLDRAMTDLTDLIERVGRDDVESAMSAMAEEGQLGPWGRLSAGLRLAAPMAERPHVPVEYAARVGGSALGSIVGAIIGARAGIRAWPWAFANDTWFAEIGRRLVRGPAEIGDLPIPYAVEYHLVAGDRQGFI